LLAIVKSALIKLGCFFEFKGQMNLVSHCKRPKTNIDDFKVLHPIDPPG
jgi:hypothetical protein